MILLILGVSTSRGVLVLLNTKEELIDKAQMEESPESKGKEDQSVSDATRNRRESTVDDAMEDNVDVPVFV